MAKHFGHAVTIYHLLCAIHENRLPVLRVQVLDKATRVKQITTLI